MVSFFQAQCLNCGTIDDVVRMDASGNESWCSQCGYTHLPARQQENVMQTVPTQQQNAADDQLTELFSRSMFLSEQQQAAAAYAAQQAQHQAAQAQQAAQQQQQQQQQEEQAPVNTYVSQHYIHYYPPPTAAASTPASADPTPAPVAQSTTTPPPNSSHQFTYIHHLLTTSPNPEAALLDYHRSLSVMEEHYYQRLGRRPSADAVPPSPTHSASSATSEEDYQLQLIMLEQSVIQAEAEKLRQQRVAKEQAELLTQQMQNLGWNGGHRMEMQNGMEVGKMVHSEVQMGGANTWGEMDDEESPCTVYYSRGRY